MKIHHTQLLEYLEEEKHIKSSVKRSYLLLAIWCYTETGMANKCRNHVCGIIDAEVLDKIKTCFKLARALIQKAHLKQSNYSNKHSIQRAL